MIKKCLIISGGDYTERLKDESYDIVIAADKGVSYAAQMGIEPDFIIGDMDSLNNPIPQIYKNKVSDDTQSCERMLKSDDQICKTKISVDSPINETISQYGNQCYLEKEAVNALIDKSISRYGDQNYEGRCELGETQVEAESETIITMPSGKKTTIIKLRKMKDDTDTMAAARHALGLGAKDITFSCATGGRLDHMLANLQTAAFAAKHNCIARLSGENDDVFVFMNNSISIEKRAGWSVSVFALTDTCEGVDISGTLYQLNEAVITNTFPVGLSNEWKDPRAVFSVKKGILAVILSRMP